MQRILLFLFLIVPVTFSYAQLVNVHVGATTAVNATFVLDKGLAEDPRYNSEMTYKFAPIGLNFGVDIGKRFGLSLEAIKSNQGQIYKLVDAAQKVKGERNIDMSFLQLPMLMKFMGRGDGKARGNFNIGPQLAFLTSARETIEAQAGTFEIPEGVEFSAIQNEFGADNVTDNGDGTYTLENNVPSTNILSKKANDFKNAEFSIAAAFGLDVDLSKHLYLTTQVRANYSITDMRNGDAIDELKAGNNIFGRRANLLVGVQIGLHYSFAKTRSHKE